MENSCLPYKEGFRGEGRGLHGHAQNVCAQVVCSLLRERQIRFECWPIDKLADGLDELSEALPSFNYIIAGSDYLSNTKHNAFVKLRPQAPQRHRSDRCVNHPHIKVVVDVVTPP